MTWEFEDASMPENKSTTPHWEFEDVNIPNQTVLDDKTGMAYSVPITMDGTDTQFAIDTQTKDKKKENYFAKAEVSDDNYGVLDYTWDAARSLAKGIAKFPKGFANMAISSGMGEREVREAKYQLEKNKKADGSSFMDLGFFGSNGEYIPVPIWTKGEETEKAIKSGEKAIETIDKIKKRNADWWDKQGEKIITDKEVNAHKGLGAIEGVGNAGASVATSVIAAIITKNPTVGAAVVSGLFGAEQAQESYDKAIEGGYDPYTAGAYANLQGTINGAIEMAGGEALGRLAHLAPVKKVGNAVSKQVMGKLLANKATTATARKIGSKALEASVWKSVVGTSLSEASEEFTQQLATDIGDNIMGLESFSFGEIMDRALYSGALALIPSGATGAIGTIAHNSSVRRVHSNLAQQAQAINPDLTEQEANDFADAAMEVLYQSASEYADATNDVLQKELDSDVMPEQYTEQDLTENMKRILRERYEYTDEQIQQMETTVNNMLDVSKQYSETYTALHDQLVNAGRDEKFADAEARLMASRALTIARASGTTAQDVLNRWGLQIKNGNKESVESLEQAAAMRKSHYKTFTEFYEHATDNSKISDQTQFNATTKDGLNIRIPQDTVRHDANKHGMSPEQWESLLANIDNVKSAIESNQKPRFSGKPILLKVKTDSAVFGVALEVFKKNNPIITSAFVDNENSIDNWLKNEAIPNGLKTSFSDIRLKDIISQVEPEYKTFFVDGAIQFQSDGENSAPRGAFYMKDGQNIIELFQNADASTVIHEMAHMFLNDMRTYSDNPETKKQLNAIYRYVGSLDGNLSTEQHEYFARSFEAYLMEGKAPNNVLKKVFNNFKGWLRRIYGEVKALNVDLDENIRKTFDEMLGGIALDYSFGVSRKAFADKVLSGEIKPSKVRERIDRLLKWSEPRTSNGKLVGRFPDVKINEQFDYIREMINTEKEDANEKIAKNLEVIDGIVRGEDTGDIDSLVWENKLLSIPAGRSNPQIMLDVYQGVSEMYNTGKFAQSITGELRKARRKRMLNALLDTLKQGKGAEWRKGSSAIQKVFRNIGRSYVGWNGLMDMLSMFDKTSKVGESALNKMYSVYEEELNMRYNIAKDGELFSDLFGKKLQGNEAGGISVARYINNLHKKTLIEWGANSKEFTKDEIVDIWMKAKDPETRKIMLEDDILQYNNEFLAKIDENMTADDVAFAESLFEFYDKTYEKLNKFYTDHYGIALGKHKYYSPRSMDRAGIEVSDGGLSSYAGLSAVKKRTAKGGAVKIKGAYNVLTNYITNSNHWLAFADKLVDINAGFGDTEAKNVIRALFGEDMNKKVAYEISRLATNDKVYTQKFGGWLSKLRSNYAVSVLGLKPSITIKQLVSFPAYWSQMSTAEFMDGLADFIKHPAEAVKTLAASKYMQTRGVNIIRDLDVVANSEKLKNLGTKAGFREFLMLNVKLGDRGAIYLGGWALYKKVLKETGSQEKAMAAFEKTTNETQQSSFMSEQSSWQSNPFMALFTMFQSSQNQYLRKEIGAVRGLLTGRMDAKTAGKTLFIYHFLLPMLFQAVSDGFRWDKDKQLRAAALGSLNGAFILGDVLDSLADFVITKKLSLKKDVSELVPFLTTLQDTADFITKSAELAGDDIDLDEYIDALIKFSEPVGEFFGVPLKYPKDVIKNIKDYLDDEEFYKAGLLSLGWSPYALRDIDND